MAFIKNANQALSILGTITLALGLPIVIFRVLRNVYFKQGLKALAGKV